jgi:hypothetical protein
VRWALALMGLTWILYAVVTVLYLNHVEVFIP